MFFSKQIISLPEPEFVSKMSLEKALYLRRSIRSYSRKGLTLVEISQLLWAAQGSNKYRHRRTSPSAGALYPLELHLISDSRQEIGAGAFIYDQGKHQLVRYSADDLRSEVSRAALGQKFIALAPVVIIITGHYSITARKYGQRAERYVQMEAGHASQNIYLQATALNLGTCAVGAFYDSQLQSLLKTKAQPLYIMPVGYPA